MRNTGLCSELYRSLNIHPLTQTDIIISFLTIMEGTGGNQVQQVAALMGMIPQELGGPALQNEVAEILERQASTPMYVGLSPDLWVMKRLGEQCTFEDCRFVKGEGNIAYRRHYHARCGHTHKHGVQAGMIFCTTQVDKAMKHQTLHPEVHGADTRVSRHMRRMSTTNQL